MSHCGFGGAPPRGAGALARDPASPVASPQPPAQTKLPCGTRTPRCRLTQPARSSTASKAAPHGAGAPDRLAPPPVHGSLKAAAVPSSLQRPPAGQPAAPSNEPHSVATAGPHSRQAGAASTSGRPGGSGTHLGQAATLIDAPCDVDQLQDSVWWAWEDQERLYAAAGVDPPAALQAADMLPALLAALQQTSAQELARDGAAGLLCALRRACWHRAQGRLRVVGVDVATRLAGSVSMAAQAGLDAGRLTLLLRYAGLLGRSAPLVAAAAAAAAAHALPAAAAGGGLTPAHAAGCLWALARVAGREAATHQERGGAAALLAELLAAQLAQCGGGEAAAGGGGGGKQPLSQVEAVMAMWAVAKLRLPGAEALTRALSAVIIDAQGGAAALPGKCLVMALWACAATDEPNPRLLSACCDVIEARAEQLLRQPPSEPAAAAGAGLASAAACAAPPPQPISAGAVADTCGCAGGHAGGGWASSGVRAGAGAGAAPEAAAAGSLALGDLCTVVWALGRLQLQRPRLLLIARSAAVAAADGMWHRDVVRLMWGLARLEAGTTAVFVQLWASLQRRGLLRRFGEIDGTMLLTATAAVAYNPGPDIMQPFVRRLAGRCHKYSANSAITLGHAASKLALPAPELYDALAASLLRTLRRVNKPGRLVVLAQSWSRAGVRDEALLAAIADRAVELVDALSTQDMLRLLTAFSSLDYHSQRLIDCIDAESDARLRRLPPPSLAMALWVTAKFGGASERSLATAADCVARQLHAMAPQQVAMVTWSFAKMEYNPEDRLMQRAAERLLERLEGADGKAVSNTLWALGKLRAHPGERVLQALADGLAPALRGFGSQSLANTLWAYARLGYKPAGPLLPAMAEQVVAQAALFEPVGVAAVLWAAGALQFRSPRALLALADAQGGRLAGYDARELANSLWGLGRLRFSPRRGFMEAAHAAVGGCAAQMRGQELFNVVWALARLKPGPSGELLDVLAREVAARAWELQPLEAANTAWAFARMRHGGEAVDAMLDALAVELPAQLPAYSMRHVVTLLWAAAVVQHSGGTLEALLLRTVQERGVGGMTMQDVAMVMQALAARGHHPGPLVDALDARSAALAPGCQAFELSSVLGSFWALGQVPEKLLGAVERHGHVLSQKVSLHRVAQDAAVLYSTLVQYGHHGGQVARAAALVLSKTSEPGACSRRALYDLMAARRLAAAGAESDEDAEEVVPELQGAMAGRCEEVWAEWGGQEGLSGCEAEVEALLRRMGLPLQRCAAVGDGGLAVPLAVELPRALLALQVLGPKQLTWGDVHQPLGTVLTRCRLLDGEGYDCVLLREESWAAADGDEGRRALLRQLLSGYM